MRVIKIMPATFVVETDRSGRYRQGRGERNVKTAQMRLAAYFSEREVKEEMN